MYTINEIIEAVKFSGLMPFNKGDQKELYEKIYDYENSYGEDQYSYGYIN